MKRSSDSILVLDSVASGTSAAFPLQQFTSVGGSAEAVGTVSGGAVIIETAPTATYSGTWSTALTLSAATGTVVTDAVDVAANFGRARISSNITGGGSVKVYINRRA